MIGAVAAVSAGAMGLFGFMTRFAIGTSRKGTMIGTLITNREKERAEMEAKGEVGEPWDEYVKQQKVWFKENAESLWLTSEHDVRIHAWKIMNPASGHRYAIVCHGYSSAPVEMAGHCRKFYDRGYSVYVPAAKGHEETGTKMTGMGWVDRIYLMQWIDEILMDDPEAMILLYGESMGAAWVMMTSGEDLPENVKCAVEDCGYTSAWDEFKYHLKSDFKLPAFPIMHAANVMSKVFGGFSFKEASALKAVARTKLPMLFIHGESDTFVPFEMLEPLCEAYGGPYKEKITVPGAGHVRSVAVLGQEYWDRVFEFTDRFMV